MRDLASRDTVRARVWCSSLMIFWSPRVVKSVVMCVSRRRNSLQMPRMTCRAHHQCRCWIEAAHSCVVASKELRSEAKCRSTRERRPFVGGARHARCTKQDRSSGRDRSVASTSPIEKRRGPVGTARKRDLPGSWRRGLGLDGARAIHPGPWSVAVWKDVFDRDPQCPRSQRIGRQHLDQA